MSKTFRMVNLIKQYAWTLIAGVAQVTQYEHLVWRIWTRTHTAAAAEGIGAEQAASLGRSNVGRSESLHSTSIRGTSCVTWQRHRHPLMYSLIAVISYTDLLIYYTLISFITCKTAQYSCADGVTRAYKLMPSFWTESWVTALCRVADRKIYHQFVYKQTKLLTVHYFINSHFIWKYQSALAYISRFLLFLMNIVYPLCLMDWSGMVWNLVGSLFIIFIGWTQQRAAYVDRSDT